MLDGVRVLEVAEYGMVPAASAVLAEWGADVIKVEHPVRGDAIRGIHAFGIAPGEGGFSYLWETFNRGKRSVGLDVGCDAGSEVLRRLIEQADVFLTSFRRGDAAADFEHSDAVEWPVRGGRSSAGC